MLSRYLRILRDLADIPLAEYQADPRNFGSGTRFLHLAIETVLSVGHHIIASAGFDQPMTYAEVFRVLGKEGVLDPGFAATLEPMARMRNRLVVTWQAVDGGHCTSKRWRFRVALCTWNSATVELGAVTVLRSKPCRRTVGPWRKRLPYLDSVKDRLLWWIQVALSIRHVGPSATQALARHSRRRRSVIES